ncbi:carbonic anhydrase [Gemmatimonadota bacterium]|nr:carbonic anhydrase [Gemmatimonadota bacterium]
MRVPQFAEPAGACPDAVPKPPFRVPDLFHLFDRNRVWATRIAQEQPGFFETLVAQQTPGYCWIGCSDSRVPANEIVDLLPGELFVHRNVANVVVHTDLNCLSVIEYAVDALKVRHIIVCGHYGCGGVRAAHDNLKIGLIDNWLRHVQDVRHKHAAIVERAGGGEAAVDRLSELNVIEQAMNVCETTIVQDAWDRGQDLTVHGWIYSLSDGRLRDLGFRASGNAEVGPAFGRAIAALDG